MEVFKIAVKLFAAADNLTSEQFVPVFHHWIQNQSVEGHRLIDVADYGHVAAGPGTVLISSEANFYTDRAENRLGLLYSRKLASFGDFQARLRTAILETLKAAAKLEREPELTGKLKFETNEILIRLNDRLLAPPTEQTVAAAKGDIQSVARHLYGNAQLTIEPKFTPQTLVEFRIKSSIAPPLTSLLAG